MNMGGVGSPKMHVFKKCKQCAKTKQVSPASGLCADCAIGNIAESVFQQKEREGPIYERGRRRLLDALDREEVSETA